MRNAHIVTGLCSAGLGAFALVEASDLDMFGEHGEPGPGFFPDLSAAALVVLGVLLVAVNLLPRRGTAPADAVAAGPPAGAQDAAVGSGSGNDSGNDSGSGYDSGSGNGDDGPGMRLRPVLRSGRVWAGFTVAVSLLQLVGFLAAMALLVAYLVLTVERIRAVRALLAVVLIPLAVYAVFAFLLGVELPTGSLFGTS